MAAAEQSGLRPCCHDRHIESLHELDDDPIGPVMSRLRDVARAVESASGADRTTVTQNNTLPGQEFDHLHFHVVPRFIGDDYWMTTDTELSAQDRIEQAAKLREALMTMGPRESDL